MKKKECITLLAVLLAALLAALIVIIFSWWSNRIVVKESKYSDTYIEFLQKMDEVASVFGDSVDMEAMMATPQGDYQNKVPCPISSYEDAIALAKKECTIEYNVIHYAYDAQLDMWWISFYEESRNPFVITLGGGQEVYIWGNGVTQAVIYTK